MFNVTKYPQGAFSWADLVSIDQSASRNFYAELMGWETQDMPMGNDQVYTLFLVDGKRVSAVGPVPTEMADQWTSSVWNNYITVDDVDRMMEKVTELGGKVIEKPFDVFEEGRMMTIHDPCGAEVVLWQPKNTIGAELVNCVGAMCWNELMTKDAAAVKDFFSKLLGWTYDTDPASEYVSIKNGERYNGGIAQLPENMSDAPPRWMTYFTVADIKATVAKAKELGGTVKSDIMHAPGTGDFAVIADPTGATFTAIQTDKPDPWTEAE